MTNLPDLATLEIGEQLLNETDERRMAWLKSRLGKFTASEFYKLTTYQNKPDILPSGAFTYVFEKVAEVLADVELETSFTSAAMQWGIDNELPAIAAFCEQFGVVVDFIGEQQQFIELTELCCGGTPDGLIGKSAGIEIKCPNSATHLRYLSIQNSLDLKEIEPKYYWQVLGLMLITKRKSWYFFSYDPRFKNESHRMHTILIDSKTVKPDLDFLKKRLEMAAEMLKNELARFCKVS